MKPIVNNLIAIGNNQNIASFIQVMFYIFLKL